MKLIATLLFLLTSQQALAYSIASFDLAFRAYRGAYSEVEFQGDRLGSYQVFCQNWKYNKTEFTNLVIDEAIFERRLEEDQADRGYFRSLKAQLKDLCVSRYRHR